MPAYIRTLPISHLTAASVGTTGDDFAIPTTPYRPRIVRVNVSAAAFVGFGADDSPPTAATTNCVHQAAGTTDYYLDDYAERNLTHLYVYSISSTIAVYVSFLG